MKKINLSIALLFLCCVTRAQVVIDSSQLNLKIKFNNIVRLLNANGIVSGTKAGTIKSSVKDGVTLLKLVWPGTIKPTEFAGIFFNNIPHLKQGVTMWRYKPWNSWTKPLPIHDATKMPDWDVQFFYWQYDDGLYAAAVPLSGNGFRTTLGSNGNQWGSKAVSYADNTGVAEVPAMAIAFGKDPYELFARIYRVALGSMGKSDDIISKKKLPVPLQYIGWCTWNSSDMGNHLNEEHVIEGVKTFTNKKFPLGWVLIDDGWFQQKDSQLQSFLPDPKKFPNGFKPLINKLKNELGIRYVGVWHAFNGYWNGIDPNSPLGHQYDGKLFSWRQKEHIESLDTTHKTYYFIKPDGNNLYNFYSTFHRYLKSEGFDFIKVDNQLVVEKMATGNYPIDSLSVKMHRALYKSADKYFNGAVINCMDMSAEAYLNFGSSAVARAVEDYFPYKKGETYELGKGNAAAHVLQAVYNAVYFSQMVYPDFDMFESNNPNAVFHAIARALNCGPIYITDRPGSQNFDVLNSLVYHDGRIVHADKPLLPTVDCLFQLQDKKIFKAFSFNGDAGLLGIFNAADADEVSGKFCAADVEHITGDNFVIYEHFSKQAMVVKKHQQFNVSLARLGYKLFYIIPIKNGFAPLGLTEKYDAPATIIKQHNSIKQATVTLYEGGLFKAYCVKKPKSVSLNGHPFTNNYQFKKNILSMVIPSQDKTHPLVTFTW
jgi:raffinose synthase